MNALPRASGPFGRTGPRAGRAAHTPRGALVIGLGAVLLASQLVLLGSGIGGRPAGPAPVPPALPVAELRAPAGLAAPVVRVTAVPALPLADAGPVAAAAPGRPGGGGPPARPEAPHADPPEVVAAVLTVATPALAEHALGLTRRERRGVQRRLVLIGYDTHGIDGVFGPDTRAAIRAWQADAALTATGYLDAGAKVALIAATEAPYRAWRARAAAGRQAAETRRIAEAASDVFGRPEDGGCVRGADGGVIARQSLVCDLKGMGEGVAGLVAALGTL